MGCPVVHTGLAFGFFAANNLYPTSIGNEPPGIGNYPVCCRETDRKWIIRYDQYIMLTVFQKIVLFSFASVIFAVVDKSECSP